MATNPLQKYFRQPKIFISLPSQGIYSPQGSITGDVNKLPVYGMTGMDEILLKTADALISGESTARVIQSCMPDITDPWSVSTLDIDLILSAIRVATYGNTIESERTCSACGSENAYSFNLSTVIDFYSNCHYENTFKLDDLTIVIRPLSYKQSTDFSLRNFGLQKRIAQINSVKDEEERTKLSDEVFKELTELRHEVFAAGIESVTANGEVVTDREFIDEWLRNVDREVTEKINKHVDSNKIRWTPPLQKAKCESCGHEDDVIIELDQSNFFVNA